MGKRRGMMGMMGMGMGMKNASMSSPMMGLMKIREDNKPSLMKALSEALADGKLTMMEKRQLKKQYPMAAESGKLKKKVMMALKKINEVQQPAKKAEPMKPSLMKAIEKALDDGKLTMMELKKLEMMYPMAAESGRLEKKIMMIAMKEGLMGVLMDAKKSDGAMMMQPARNEGIDILRSMEGSKADRKFAATNAFRKKVGLPPLTREKFEAKEAKEAEEKALIAKLTMMENMQLKMAIKKALADGKLTMMEKMELKKEFPKAAKSGQLDKKIMMVQMMLDTIKMEARPAMMQNMELKMAIKEALADGKISMMEKKELQKEFPMAAESGKLDKKIMMVQMMLEKQEPPAAEAPRRQQRTLQSLPTMMELKKAIKDALADGKISMMEKRELKEQFPDAAESGKLNKKIMMVQMMLESIKMDTTPEAMMMNMELKMAIKDALADGKISMMEKKELKKEFPIAAESGKLDKKIMMVQMMLDSIKMDPVKSETKEEKVSTPSTMMMNMALKKAIKEALEDGKITMMEKMALKMQFPEAAKSGQLDKKIMMIEKKREQMTTESTEKDTTPSSMMSLKMAIKEALADGKLTMMEKMQLKMDFPEAHESGKLDKKLDKIADKKGVHIAVDAIAEGEDASGGDLVYDGTIDSGVKKGDPGPHHGLMKVNYQESIDNYDPSNLDFVTTEGAGTNKKYVIKKPELKRKDYSADDFRSEAFKSELDSRGLTGKRRGGTVTTFKDQTGTFRRVPTDASGVPKALTSDGMGGFKDLGSPPTLSTERDLFGDLDETRQSKLATIKSIVDNPQPAASQMAIAMRTSKGLGILMDAGFTQTRTRMQPLLMTPPPNERETRAAIARIGNL